MKSSSTSIMGDEIEKSLIKTWNINLFICNNNNNLFKTLFIIKIKKITINQIIKKLSLYFINKVIN